MNRNAQSESGKRSWVHQVLGYTIILLVVFLLGFVPVWLRSRDVSRRLAESEQQLTLAQTQNILASAAIDARQGNYEAAHQSAGDFFTVVQTEMDKGADSAFSPAQSEEIRLLLDQRDELVTLLARSDPAAADRLADLYSAYREVVE